MRATLASTDDTLTQQLKSYLTRPLFLILILVAVAGCSRDGEIVDAGPTDQTATDVVVAARWDTMGVAFERLEYGELVEHQKVEVWHSGEIQASRTAILEYSDGQPVSLETTDSTGTFEQGWIRSMIGPLSEIKSPIANWTDGEPPYESPRRRTLFRFSALPDSTVAGSRVVRHQVAARASDEPLRQARFAFLPSGADTVSGLQVVRVEEIRLEEAPFFEQGSSVVVQLAQVDARWEPASIVMDVTVDAPGRSVRRYRVERVFTR